MTPPPGWPPQGAPPGWPPQAPPPWAMAPMPMYMPVLVPPPPPLPSRDRLLAGVLIADVVLGPMALIGLFISALSFGPGSGPGSLGFKTAGLLFALFFLSIAAAPIVLRDLAGRNAPRAMVPLAGITIVVLVTLALVVGVIFTTSGVQTPSILPVATGLFTAAAALLTLLNVLMITPRQTTLAVPALGVVFGALSMGGGLLITIVTFSSSGGGAFGAGIAAGILIVVGFICYLIWAVLLGIVVLKRPVVTPGAAHG